MLARDRTQFNFSRSRAVRGIRWLPAALWMGGIFYLSHQSAPPTPVGSGISPVLGHMILYAILTALLYIAVLPVGRGTPTWIPISIAFALAVLYGVSDEVHQGFVPGRVPSEVDLLADALGAGIASLALFLCGHLLSAHRNSSQHRRQSP